MPSLDDGAYVDFCHFLGYQFYYSDFLAQSQTIGAMATCMLVNTGLRKGGTDWMFGRKLQVACSLLKGGQGGFNFGIILTNLLMWCDSDLARRPAEPRERVCARFACAEMKGSKVHDNDCRSFPVIHPHDLISRPMTPQRHL